MRKLWQFSLLCLGAVALLASWCVVFVVAGGLILKVFGWWLLPGVLLALLLLCGGGLVLPFRRTLGTRESAPIDRALDVFRSVGIATLVGAALIMLGAAPQVYHAYAGERTEAVVTDAEPAEDQDYFHPSGSRYRVMDPVTAEDLGWLERSPAEGAILGDRIEISVDPHGWVGPVAAQRLGWTTTPTTLLVLCLAATTLTALGVVAAALQAWAWATATGASRRGREALRSAGPR